MPTIRVEKDYLFTAPGGGESNVVDLFDSSRQELRHQRGEGEPDLHIEQIAREPAAKRSRRGKALPRSGLGGQRLASPGGAQRLHPEVD